MVPSVAGYLMAFVYNASDDRGPLTARGINGAFAEIISGHKECGFRIVSLENVEKICGIMVWSIVEGYGIGTGDRAGRDLNA